MKLFELDEYQFKHLIQHDGLRLRIGPFYINLISAIPSVTSSLLQLYRDVQIDRNPGYSDFHIRVDTPASLRRWVRPQVLFFFDHQLPFKPLPLAHAFPLLEWGLNWCIAKYAHQYLIIHAAVLEKGGKAIILPGPPGSGKSTLCAGLLLKGWRLLSDEMALLDPETTMLTPIPRPVALKNESIDIIKEFDLNAIVGPSSFDTSKGTVAHLRPTTESMDRSDEQARPAFILFPRYTPGSENRIESKDKSMTFMELINNMFNYNILRKEGFETTCSLLDMCECCEFQYSDLESAVNYLNDFILQN